MLMNNCIMTQKSKPCKCSYYNIQLLMTFLQSNNVKVKSLDNGCDKKKKIRLY